MNKKDSYYVQPIVVEIVEKVLNKQLSLDSLNHLHYLHGENEEYKKRTIKNYHKNLFSYYQEIIDKLESKDIVEVTYRFGFMDKEKKQYRCDCKIYYKINNEKDYFTLIFISERNENEYYLLDVSPGKNK